MPATMSKLAASDDAAGDFAAVVGDTDLLQRAQHRTLVVANVVYTELLDAMRACGSEENASAAARLTRNRKRARTHDYADDEAAEPMDVCAMCDGE